MIKEITIGTTNPAKLDQIKGVLSPLGISIMGPKEKLPDVEEDGSLQENAIKKAVTYAKYLGVLVLSMDNGLYFDNLEEQLQPGTNVRRILGKTSRPTDSELIEYYGSLIKSLGDRVNAHWEFCVCVANTQGKHQETTIISPRVFVSIPSINQIPGYPLESFQIDPDSGRFISDLTAEEKDEFWRKIIGKQITEFIQSINL